MRPDAALMRLYGTEAFFLEKNAAGVPPLPMRVMNALRRYSNAKEEGEQGREQHIRDDERNQMIRALVAAEMSQATGNMRHTRVPLILAAMGSGGGGMRGEDMPLGFDEGMVRMASYVVPAAQDLLALEKDAGRLGTMLAGAAQKVTGLGKSVAGGVASGATNLMKTLSTTPKIPNVGAALAPKNMGTMAFAKTMPAAMPTPAPVAKTLSMTPGTIAAAPKSTPGTIMAGAPPAAGRPMGVSQTGAPSSANPTLMAHERTQQAYGQLSPDVQKALQGSHLVQHGMPPEIAAQLARVSAAPGESATASMLRHSALPGPTPAPPSSIPAMKPPAGGAPAPPANPRSTAYRTQATAAPTSTPGAPPPPAQPALQHTAPSAPPAQPGLMQRLGNDLGNGQWKMKGGLLAAAALGTYGAVKGVQAGSRWLSQESHPQTFNQGAPQLAYGVNQYNVPQMGGQLQ